MAKITGGGVKLTGDWPRFRHLLDPGGFSKRLEREVGRATAANARFVARAIRSVIKAAPWGGARQADLTAAIKGSTKPLVDFGELFKAVTTVNISWDVAFAGVLRTARGKTGDLFNLAVDLHEGVTIPVTEAMRGMFALLYVVSRGFRDPGILRGRALALYRRNPRVVWQKLRPDTTRIVIPSRPFVRLALERPDLVDTVVRTWQEAVGRALYDR